MTEFTIFGSGNPVSIDLSLVSAVLSIGDKTCIYVLSSDRPFEVEDNFSHVVDLVSADKAEIRSKP